MSAIIRKALASLLLAASVTAAYAVPAKPGLIKMTQPDGTELNVRLHGDEFHHFYTTEDGYYLISRDDTFYYADIAADGTTVNSGIAATAPAARTAAARAFLDAVNMDAVRAVMTSTAEARLGKMAQTTRVAAPAFAAGPDGSQQRGPGLFPGSHFPATGNQKGLVILVEYQDVKMTVSNPHDYFSRMLNEQGFNTYGGTGSAKDFFLEVSNGVFNCDFDVYGPVTLPNNMAYYGGNDYSGNDQRPAHMVRDACDILNGEIDFSQYDRDHDGEVDNVFVFYAGRGEASGGSPSTVWPHAWNVEYGVGYRPQYDGVYVSRYACSNEWEGSRPDGVGTFIHEFSHVMGLPDLYATSYTGAFTPGSWSCMDYGPYNNSGRTPPLYGAFERYALGWLQPVELNGPTSVTLPAIGENVACIIPTAKSNEFFLFENRQKQSWDTYIPGHGMLAWHIDYNSSVWNNNTVNNSSAHQYVDIEEADGTKSEGSRAGDAFPGTSNVRSFSDSGTPNMLTWSGQGLNMPITEITEANGVITFDVCGGMGAEVNIPEEVATDTFDDESFTISWKGVTGLSYIISVFTRANGAVTEANREYLSGYNHLNVGKVSTFTITGLTPQVTYYYTVSSSNGWNTSEESPEIAVTTSATPLSKVFITAYEPDDVTHNSFTASWTKVDAATDYILNVFTKVPNTSKQDICNFDKGVSSLPEGWETNALSGYANSSYSGQSQPAIRLADAGEYISTATYADEILRFSFWHRGSGASPNDQLAVYAEVNGRWKMIKEVEIVNEPGGAVTDIELDLAGVHRMRIELDLKSTSGAVALDDITVTYGDQPTHLAVDGFKDLLTGDVNSLKVTGLEPDTKYYYTVRATDGTYNSSLSNEVAVRTILDSGVIAIEAADADQPVIYYNLQGIPVANPTAGVYIRRQGATATRVLIK